MAWFVRRLALDAALAREFGYHHRIAELEAELGFERRRAEEAIARETYWRVRAEKFIDQIALRSGNIGEPTMTEVPPPPRDAAATAMAALSRTVINHNGKSEAPEPRMRVNAVDGALAMQEVSRALGI